MPYLPSGESLPQTAEEIQNTLTSPQFQQVGAWLSGELLFSSPPVAPFALLLQVPDAFQCRKSISRSGEEEGQDLMEHKI